MNSGVEIFGSITRARQKWTLNIARQKRIMVRRFGNRCKSCHIKFESLIQKASISGVRRRGCLWRCRWSKMCQSTCSTFSQYQCLFDQPRKWIEYCSPAGSFQLKSPFILPPRGVSLAAGWSDRSAAQSPPAIEPRCLLFTAHEYTA